MLPLYITFSASVKKKKKERERVRERFYIYFKSIHFSLHQSMNCMIESRAMGTLPLLRN